MKNSFDIYGNSWRKYLLDDNNLWADYELVIPAADTVTVVSSLNDIGIRRGNDGLTCIPVSNTTEMEYGLNEFMVWKLDHSTHTSEYFENYKVISNAGGGHPIIDRLEFDWIDLRLNYGLVGYSSESSGSGEGLRGYITEIYNENVWPPIGTYWPRHYAYITDETLFLQDGNVLYLKDFVLLHESLTDTTTTLNFYDAANCWNSSGTGHIVKPIWIGNPVDPDKLYSYSYNATLHNYFNSNLCKGKYVFISNGSKCYESTTPQIPFKNDIFKIPSDYKANNASPIWDFTTTSQGKAYQVIANYILTVTSASPDTYPADGPLNGYYYIKVYDPTSSGTTYGTLSDSDIIGGVNYSIDINSDTDIQVGQCASASISFQTRSNSLGIGSVIKYWCNQIDLSLLSVGSFIVTDITKTGNIYNVTANDYLSKFDVNVYGWYTTSRNYVSDIFSSLCSLVGVTGLIGDHCNSGAYLNFEPLKGTEEISGRTILGYIAGMGGCIAMADGNGNITFKKYGTSSSHTLTNASYTSLSHALYAVPQIDRLEIKASETEEGYIAGTGNNPLYIIGNKLFNSTTPSGGTQTSELRTVTDNIYTCVSAIPTYVPCLISTYRDFGINVGDVITIDNMRAVITSKSWSASGVQFTSTGSELRNQLKNKRADVNQVSDKVNEVSNVIDSLIDDDGYVSYDSIGGGSLSIGGPNNEYGILQAFDNGDNNIGYWDNAGLEVNDITINQSLYQGHSLTYYLEHMSARFG